MCTLCVYFTTLKAISSEVSLLFSLSLSLSLFLSLSLSLFLSLSVSPSTHIDSWLTQQTMKSWMLQRMSFTVYWTSPSWLESQWVFAVLIIHILFGNTPGLRSPDCMYHNRSLVQSIHIVHVRASTCVIILCLFSLPVLKCFCMRAYFFAAILNRHESTTQLENLPYMCIIKCLIGLCCSGTCVD